VNLKQLRESKSLTQDQAAAKSSGKLTQGAISQLELGRVEDPKHSTITTLAEVYEVDSQTVIDALSESVRAAEAA
jgi:transcriptional regulator with XRE-family HTH domain